MRGRQRGLEDRHGLAVQLCRLLTPTGSATGIGEIDQRGPELGVGRAEGRAQDGERAKVKRLCLGRASGALEQRRQVCQRQPDLVVARPQARLERR